MQKSVRASVIFKSTCTCARLVILWILRVFFFRVLCTGLAENIGTGEIFFGNSPKRLRYTLFWKPPFFLLIALMSKDWLLGHAFFFGGKVVCPNQILNSYSGPAWRSTTFDSNSSPLWVLNRKNFKAPLLSGSACNFFQVFLEMSWKKFICNAIFSWCRVMFFENVYFRVHILF